MESSSSHAGSLRGLPGRLGQTLLAPRAALERVDREAGGVTDALWLVVLASVTFRFPQLLEAVLGLAIYAGTLHVLVPGALTEFRYLVGRMWKRSRPDGEMSDRPRMSPGLSATVRSG